MLKAGLDVFLICFKFVRNAFFERKNSCICQKNLS